jgi:Gp5 N-terminal OB domain
MATNKHIMGFDGFIWFQGVVEDRYDPLKLGRVRVRCLGIHTDDLHKIPTESLPWAHVMMPITSASMSGIGQSPTGLVDGTWVFGFFRDGESCQEPVIIGSIPGVPEEKAVQDRGFYDQRDYDKLSKDPRKITTRSYPFDGTGASFTDEETAQYFPREVGNHPLGCELGEPDTNRLARNDATAETIIQVKLDSRDLNVPTALGAGGIWSEPPTAYSAQYPYNHVTETESGHLVELDDTPGCERTHNWHRTGTSVEVGPKGDKIERIVRDGYEIVLRNNYVHICGTANVTVNGNINIYTKSGLNVQVDKDALMYVKGDLDVRVDGDAQVEIGGDLDAVVHGDGTVSVDGTVSATVGQDLVANVFGDTELSTAGNTKINTAGDVGITTGGDVEMVTSGNVNHTVAGTYKVTSAGNMTFTAPRIDLNPV